MITAKAFAGKHYAVYGLARSGLATVDVLLASGARVTAWDDRLFPGEGRGPGRCDEQRFPLPWTPAFAGELAALHHLNSPWMYQPGAPPRPSPIRPSR